MKKLLIISNWLAPYRIPLYEKLIDNFNTKFIWLHIWDKEEIKELSKKIYDNSYFSTWYKKTKLWFKISSWFEKYLYELDYDYVLSLPSVYPEVWKIFYIVKYKRKKKLILWDEEFEWQKSWKRKLIMPITKFINRKSDYILVPSNKHREWQLKLWVNKNKIKLFPNVTNLNLNDINFKKIKELKEKYNIWNKKVIMYVWQLIPRKGVNYLIEAYSNLIKENKKLKKETILIIVWNWNYRNELENLWKKIEKIWWNIIFTWKIDNKELINYYELATIWIVPSVNINWEAEPYALVLNEYMILWKSVISSNMVWATYALLKNNKVLKNFIVEEKNSEQIKEKLKYLLNLQEKEHKNIQNEILNEIEKYNNYDKNLKVLRKIII